MRVNRKVSGWINSVCVNLLLTFLLVTLANATNEYSFTTIDFPGAGIDVRGINNAGQIVGSVDYSDFSSDGFVLSGGSFTTFNFPGAFGTVAVGINDAGQIVGHYGGCCGAAKHGFLLSEGSFSTIDFPGALQTNANGINNAGQVSGNIDAGGTPHGFLATPLAIEVSVDIKPGSFPNSINLGSGGTVPVAIFSTTTFDARTVDPTTVTLASASVALRGKGTLMTSFEDVNGDGLLDLVVHISTQALQLSEADEEAVLNGKTSGGTPIRGSDTVRVVP